jgi:hypothetical protein
MSTSNKVTKTQKKKNMGRSDQKLNPMQMNSLICNTANEGNVSLLLQVVNANMAQLNMINMSTSFHRLAKRVTSDRVNVNSIASNPVVLALDSRVRQALEQKEKEFSSRRTEADGDLARCLSTIAWSYATLMLHKPKTLECIGRLAMQRKVMESLKSFELANLLWAFAKAKMEDRRVFESSEKLIKTRLHEFNPVSLSIVSWAFAKSRAKPCSAVLRLTSRQFLNNLKEAQSQELANMCWSLATASVIQQPVFAKLGEACTERIAEFNIQELSNVAWAFARAQCCWRAFLCCSEAAF